MAEPASFYYDLGSPYAYLAAERIHSVFEEAGAPAPVWKPVLLGGLFARFDRGSWARTDAREEGMRFLRESAIEKVLTGLTTLREINKVTFVE